MGDGDGETTEGELPVGSLVAEPLGDGERALQAVVDAGRPGEQRAVVGIVAAPRDLAGLALEVEREVDGGLDRRPLLAEVVGVAGDEVVVPGTGGDVAGDVGVERRVLDVVTQVVGVPAPVVPLLAGQPAVRGPGLLVPAAQVEGHGRLDQVPGVGVTIGGPRDVAVGELMRRDGVDGYLELRRGDDALDGGEQVVR